MTHWQGKAALMHIFSVSPWGKELHYLAQRCVTRSLPSTNEKFAESFGRAEKHLKALARFSSAEFDGARFYEFGAGWELAIPLSFYVLGVRAQVLVDIRRLLRVELVNETVRKLQKIGRENRVVRIPESFLDERDSERWTQVLQEQYGIVYLAPCDARRTGLEQKTVDFITSTNTLEHIPPDDIRMILAECRRLLKKGGLMSFIIDYQDHYSYCDESITAYNFLKYSDAAWRLYNPAFHYQNRLRHKDYACLFQEEGFQIIEENVVEPSKDDIASLQQTRISRQFKKHYSVPDLGIRSAHTVLRLAS